MGGFLSRFRKKQSTIEILEALEKDISNLVKFRRKNQELQKKFIGSLIIYSIFLYIVCAVLFYFLYLPDTWKLRFLYSTPLLVFPFLVWGFKKFLHWYFVKRITENDVALRELKEKKKQILEDVMENETYKKAKEILEKYDPERFKQLEKPPVPKPTSPPGSQVRQRVTSNLPSPPPSIIMKVPPKTPVSITPSQTPQTVGLQATPQIVRQTPIHPRNIMSNGRTASPAYGQPPGPPLPRPVLPRDRSTTDKLLDYLVGDGPEHRYALICKACCSHNGMALKEEFEYISFRCCYCYVMNHARKQRPFAPKLEFPKPKVKLPLRKDGDTTGEIGEDVDEDDDDESGSEDDELQDSGDGDSEMEVDVSIDNLQEKDQLSKKSGGTSLPAENSVRQEKGEQVAETVGVRQVKGQVQTPKVLRKDADSRVESVSGDHKEDVKSFTMTQQIKSENSVPTDLTEKVPSTGKASEVS